MNRLKELRKEKGLTLDEIQSETGINRGTYNNYESGKTEPKPETWQALADYFNVSIPYLQGKILFVDLSEDEQRIFTDVLDVLITTTDNKAIHVLEALLNSFKECYFEENTRIAPEKNRKGNN
ncbi:helix-turn-helix domain-containing protein [Lactobacillus johnsonii]|uniref:helix-turn-helix domain-containing protein n=1 Tax=Lactobacillus johnsonii TaxID=33959 RepID=UPI003CFE7DA9